MDRRGEKKKSLNFPDIRGFERFPEGKLLTQKVDFDGPFGIAYERCIGYTKAGHSHDRLTITFPRGSSRSFIKVFPEAKNFSLTEEVVHLMAKDHLHEQGSVSSIYDTFALFVTEDHFENHLRNLGVPVREIQSFLKTTQSLQRSAILNDLVRRYFFVRILEQRPSPVELKHLEGLLMSELFSLSHKRWPSPSKAVSAQFKAQGTATLDDTALLRAVEFIEAHLFEDLNVQSLVNSSRTSQATLFRLFKRELHASPIEYVRNRRLDEANSLLKTGQYQVSDVALLVGYDDLSTFSKAYKQRFQLPPSRALPTKTESKKRSK